MEETELGSLMLSTCIVGTLLYSTDSPLNYLELSCGFRSVLMGTAIAVIVCRQNRLDKFVKETRESLAHRS
jgi:hypothetical protein